MNWFSLLIHIIKKYLPNIWMIWLCFLAPAENPVPGVGSLKINGDGNGYDTDARTALETVTEKPGNMSEVTTVLNKWLDLAEANEDIGEAVARSACELMAHGEYGDKIREITLGRIFQMFKGNW